MTKSHSADAETAETSRKSKSNRCWFGIGAGLGGIVGLALFFGLYFGLPPREVVVESSQSTTTTAQVTSTTASPSYSGEFARAAVASDAAQCSTVGKNILLQNGSAVDSAIATMLCVGLYNSHSCGIGGGFFMVFYEAASGKATFFNARETAAAAATKDMFQGNGELSTLGSLAVAIPGEIAGYWEAHQRYGKLNWDQLFEPTIQLAENGTVVSQALANAIAEYKDVISNKTFNLWPVYTNADGSLKKQGDIVRRPALARTLRKIATEGADVFYNGSLASDIVADLNDGFGKSNITLEDLKQYSVDIKSAINVSVDNLTVFTSGSPSGGPVLSLILNILDGYNFQADSISAENKVLTYHRIVEAFKFAFGKRSALGDDRTNETITELISNMTADWFADSIRAKINDNMTNPLEYYEPEFQLPEDHGTAHLSLIASNGDAVAMTSTINTEFGSKVRGFRTGIIFNNEMDDFSSPNITNYFGVPPSPSNFIQPGNRPLSSMSPTIVVDRSSDKEEVLMISGASGGTRIITGTALTLMNCLWFGQNVDESVERKRLHHQLLPDEIRFENGFDEEVVAGLESKGHNSTFSTAGSIVQAVLRKNEKIYAASDFRKGGIPDGY